MKDRVVALTPKIKKFSKLPTHIAIVPDGNGRWAEQRNLPRLDGHQVGAENMHRMVNYLSDYPIKYVTLYGFSTENWSRPEEEVNGLFQILANFIEDTLPEINQKDIKLRHLGRLEKLPKNLQSAINTAVEVTRNNTRMTLSVAFNYGGRAEIVDAVRRIISKGISPQNVDEELFSNYLYTAGLPNVDLLIRTGDELRLSNFLIWQTSYSEYHFTKVLWPDFGKKDIEKALLSYSRRQRRFGGL
jgi:undecaprenyl diphosphate synthase